MSFGIEAYQPKVVRGATISPLRMYFKPFGDRACVDDILRIVDRRNKTYLAAFRGEHALRARSTRRNDASGPVSP